MVVDPGNIILTDYAQEIWTYRSCVFHGEQGDISFYFYRGKLNQIQRFFRSVENENWSEEVLEELRAIYGPETKEQLRPNGEVGYYIWELVESSLVFKTGNRSAATINLIEKWVDTTIG